MERSPSVTSTSSTAAHSRQATPHHGPRTAESKTPVMEPTTPTRGSNRSPLRRMANLPAESSTIDVTGFTLPQSPTLADIHSFRSHTRTNSDVQGLVKRFEHLDVRDRDAENQERRRKHEAELRRAQIAREEAESDVKRLRAELRALKKEHDDSRERERKIAKRLEVVLEESANAKEAHAAGSGVYEKELRKIRKEAFKSSSTVVKLQEELKSARNSLRTAQAGLDLEKQKSQRREQDTFSAQYQLVAVQEELERLKAQLYAAEEERNALKTSLKEEEVARIAAEGMIALPNALEEDEDLLSSSPRKESPAKIITSLLSDDKENLPAKPRKLVELRQLEEDLRRENMLRQQAEGMADFLRMECAFGCCTCRRGLSQDHHTTALTDFEFLLDQIRDDMKRVLRPRRSASSMGFEDLPGETEPNTVLQFGAFTDEMLVDDVGRTEKGGAEAAEDLDQTSLQYERQATLEAQDEEELSRKVSAHERQRSIHELALFAPEARHSPGEHLDRASQPTSASIPAPPPLASQASSGDEEAISTPVREHAGFRTVTTTTTIPMHFTPASKAPMILDVDDEENVPPHVESTMAPVAFDREAALAAIQYRRGRAKSIANGHATPRKQMLEGVSINERRDISAPALGGKTVGTTVKVQGSASVGRGRPNGRLG